MSLDTAGRTLQFTDLGLGSERIDYQWAWDLQRQIHAEVLSGERPDTVLLLEHEDVYTAGKRTEPDERPTSGSTPVIDVDRGGKLTWHGVGQLVAYPIVKLPDGVFVVDFVRRLEEAMIRTFADLGQRTIRIDGRSGVWLGEDDPADGVGARPARKIAAIGIRVASQVTMHGLAMNITNSLDAYDRIVPCGISDAGVTTLAAETGTSYSLREVADRLQPHLLQMFGWQPYQQS
jgi:lipoyl(octanoyl) transferase